MFRTTSRTTFALLVAACLALSCNKEGNPVLPTDPGGSDPGKLTITITADRSQLEAGSATAATLKIAARRADQKLPQDGTVITLNTNLGSFGSDATGKPIQSTTRELLNGAAEVPFYAGTKSGVANVIALAGTSTGAVNLTIVDPPAVPQADFTFTQSGLAVLFTDASTGSPTSYSWHFGDGGTSSEKNPQYTYKAAGTYTVTLEVSNSGGSSTKSKFVELSLGAAPQAAFAFTVTGRQVNFVDQSKGNPTSWEWQFGDDKKDTTQNPVHVYDADGPYTVLLTATNAAGSSMTSQVISIGTAPVAKFKFTVVGRTATFINQSTGNPTTYLWDFGDNSTSTAANPSPHTYSRSGTFVVVLTVTNAVGSSSVSDAVTIVPVPPKAAFEFTVNGNQVNFVDRSTGTPLTWLWDFGDGSSDQVEQTKPSPTHFYGSTGSFTVKLTVSNTDGTDSTSQVVVISPPKADFEFTINGQTVSFFDRSTGGPLSYSWNFGDGKTSALANPTHTYTSPGTYTVTLTVRNGAGADSVSKVVSTITLSQ